VLHNRSRAARRYCCRHAPRGEPSDPGDRLYFAKIRDRLEKREPHCRNGGDAVERDTKRFLELVHKDML
jgi:long-subunit acyl-CoA synthetase (AMP-forming)